MYQIDNQSRNPIYEQIIEQTEKYILSGILKPDENMPSVRSLSMSLSLNPNTVQRAYTELERKGLVYSLAGKGTFVSNDALEILKSSTGKKIDEMKLIVKNLFLSGLGEDELIDIIKKIYGGIDND